MSPGRRPLRVMLVDADQFSRDGLGGMLEAEGALVAAAASDLAEARAAMSKASPDVIVVDPSVGEDAAAILGSAATATPLAVLADSAEQADVMAALTAGARSYLLKDAPAQELVSAIRQTAAGSTVLGGPAAHALFDWVAERRRTTAPSALAGPPGLSERETEVLAMLVAGADNLEIGKALSISRHTVKQHVSNIFDKLGVRTRVEAAVLAVRERLV